jgi:hypothetical protein
MKRHLTLYLHEKDIYSEENKRLVVDHPSGFKAVLFSPEYAKIFHIESIVEVLKIVRESFTAIIYPSDPSEDPEAIEYLPDLKKLHDFFSIVDPRLMETIREKAAWWDFSYGHYDEQRDYSENTNRLLDIYKGQSYFLVEGQFNHIFNIEAFRENLKSFRIEKVDCWDSMGIMFFLQDLEEGTFLKAFQNLLEISRINEEIAEQKDYAAQEYCRHNEPWKFIK